MHTLTELVSTFGRLFPSLSENVLYYLEGPNTIRIHPESETTRDRDLIFVYDGRLDYKLLTFTCYQREEKDILNLRNELSTIQTNFKNYKRSCLK